MTMAETTAKNEQSEKTDFFVVRTIKEAKETYAARLKEYNEKYACKARETGKEFIDGIEKDARKVLNNMIENGKKYKDRLPMVGSMEKKFNNGWSSVREQIDLPSKTDIERLTIAMNALNDRVNDLNRKYSD